MVAIRMTEFVALVPSKEGFYAFLSEIRRPKRAASRANGRVGKLESALVSIVSIKAIASLQVTDNHLTTRVMVGVMTKGFHRKNLPAFFIM